MKRILILLLMMVFLISGLSFAFTINSGDQPKNGSTRNVVYYMNYEELYALTGHYYSVKGSFDKVAYANDFIASLLPAPGGKAAAGFLFSKIASSSLNALTGYSEFNKLLTNNVKYLFMMKPNADSVVTQALKLNYTQTYKRNKATDYEGVWFTTSTKYELVDLSEVNK